MLVQYHLFCGKVFLNVCPGRHCVADPVRRVARRHGVGRDRESQVPLQTALAGTQERGHSPPCRAHRPSQHVGTRGVGKGTYILHAGDILGPDNSITYLVHVVGTSHAHFPCSHLHSCWKGG